MKKLSHLKGKKRYILFGLIGMELMSLPAAAAIVHKAAFEVRPVVTAVEIPTAEPGVSRFIVTSNAGFDVKANQMVGDVMVKVHVNGSLPGGNRFGDSAQLPGPEMICSQSSGSKSAIYKADRKIESQEGSAPDRAVIMEFTYDDLTARPEFEFVAGQDKELSLSTCST